MKIDAERPKIDVAAALDLIGKEFRFDHAKGISEWLKNSVDAYNQTDVPDEDQIMVISLSTSSNDYVRRIEVLDFVGMSKSKIDEAFKVWFSPDAAKITNELIISQRKTYGGHGNGGKFYMRQMFKEAIAITYLKGKVNVFGFNDKKQYGYVEEYKNLQVEPSDAIKIAGLDKRGLPDEWFEGVRNGSNGFTKIQGFRPVRSSGTNYMIKLVDKIVRNPQARRLIARKRVYLQSLPETRLVRLSVPKIAPKAGFEGPVEYVCPDKVDLRGKKIKMVNRNNPEPPRLTLHTSDEPLRGASLLGLNSIDFLGEIGVVASYQIHELGRFPSSFVDFVYGECLCPIMEDPEEDCVRNDREKFIRSDRSQALLLWVEGCIDQLTSKMEQKHRREKRKRDLRHTSDFNQILNTWKNRFITSLLRKQSFGEEAFEGVGGNDESGAVIGKNPGKRTGRSGSKKRGTKGGDKTRKAPAQPRVLISGHDDDPLSETGEPYECDPRQPAVHQRFIDVPYGIYWINTSKQLASKILDREGADSPQWRGYLFQRYVDIIVKEAIYQLGKLQLNLTADDVNRRIDEIISNVQDKASEDLEEFLFEKGYKP